jgi:uncharacterized protein (DUF2141 family)
MSFSPALALCAFLALASAYARADSLSDTVKNKINDAIAEHGLSQTSDYDAAEAAIEAVWMKMPLSVRHAVFVTQKASGYGIYQERSNIEFKQGETLNIYAEPIGYNWKPLDIGGYAIGVTTDLVIKDSEGKIIFEKPEFGKLSFTSHDRNKEFNISLDIKVDGLKTGSYQIEIKLHDMNGAKTASFSLPFKFVNGS